VVPCLLQSRIDAGAKTPDLVVGTCGAVVAVQSREECEVQWTVGSLDLLADSDVVAGGRRDVFVLFVQRLASSSYGNE
jgi:hypothetical protein